MKKNFLAISALAVAFIVAVVLCLQTLTREQAVFSSADEKMKIVIDAGHGGIDGGVKGIKTGIKESDLNLSIAQKLQDEFLEIGFEVVLTRPTQDGLYGTSAKGFKKRDMLKRKEIVEESNPALVLSIHQNFYPTHSTRGAQVFYHPSNEKSKTLALCVQEKLNALYTKQNVKGRSAFSADYFMLTCTLAPSVIVECGFLSNEKDEKLLVQESWQKHLAESIVAGALAYFSQSTC